MNTESESDDIRLSGTLEAKDSGTIHNSKGKWFLYPTNQSNMKSQYSQIYKVPISSPLIWLFVYKKLLEDIGPQNKGINLEVNMISNNK